MSKNNKTKKNIGKPKMVEWVDRYDLEEWCLLDW